jgi:hypothetical protein
MEKTEIETRTGRCSTHGQVEATREIPRSRFPFAFYSVLRVLARRRPFRCPSCASAVTTS